jgi:hypothetical protein
MKPIDILYTPLIAPPVPSYDYTKLLSWIHKFYSTQTIQDRQDASERVSSDIYPWNIVYAKYRKSWCFNFEKEFPQLASFFAEAYNLSTSEINSVVLLPVKDNHCGLVFWHRDPDEWGLRMYLENTELENSLLIKPTKLPYNLHSQVPDIDGCFGPWDTIQDVQYAANIPNSRQVFYINNVRAIHTVNKNIPSSKRLAVIVSVDKSMFKMPQHLQDLIVTSAEHYKDSAIYWSPEIYSSTNR